MACILIQASQATPKRIYVLGETRSQTNSQIFLISAAIHIFPGHPVAINDNRILLPSEKAIGSFHDTVTSAKRTAVKETRKVLRRLAWKARKIVKHRPEEEGKADTMAIVGLVCSIVGLILLIATGWPFFLGTLGLIFSAIGLINTQRDKKPGKGLSIIGIVLGVLDIVLFWALLDVLFIV